ncbi:MAG: SDR family NAD(P)-dependent oxidoreductase [Solirubrobacterales bacterium]
MSVPAPIYPDLRNRVLVITGGTKGIGLAVAHLLVANGARVVINGRSPSGTESARAELEEAGGEVVCHATDVSHPEGLDSLREATLAAFGRVDGLVAFAGGFGARTPLVEIDLKEWDTVIRENLTATFLAVRRFLPDLEASGRGSIVTMASNAGRQLDMPITASYAAAKAGVVMFTRHAALECGSAGVRINCVAPATVLSPRVERVMDEQTEALVAGLSPLGTIGVPEDVAGATVFLLSDSASWMTGVTLDVAGGRVMQ